MEIITPTEEWKKWASSNSRGIPPYKKWENPFKPETVYCFFSTYRQHYNRVALEESYHGRSAVMFLVDAWNIMERENEELAEELTITLEKKEDEIRKEEKEYEDTTHWRPSMDDEAHEETPLVKTIKTTTKTKSCWETSEELHWGLSHWTAGIGEYFLSCCLCNFKQDPNRAYILKRYNNDIIGTSDCIIATSGIHANPLSGTLCCPIATFIHCCSLPCVCCCCSKVQTTSFQSEYHPITHYPTHSSTSTTGSPAMVDNKSVLNAQLDTAASRKEAAERNARYEAKEKQNQQNRQREEQRQKDWRGKGTWS